jgi:dimethylhistidine N-methyltransferase
MQTAALAFERLADEEAFARAVARGLGSRPKAVPCRFLYDARGSMLFEQITDAPEYYPTRTELGLLRGHAGEIAELCGSGAALVEFGSGSSRKTRLLLDAMTDLHAYVPVDIAEDALFDAAAELAEAYPGLSILPVHADFAAAVQLPLSNSAPRVGFFPGSTIGNFTAAGAELFLRSARRLLGPSGALIVGVDLRKDESLLIPAYNDAGGVTAEFNLNLLDRINRELDGEFDRAGFAHKAIWNAHLGRMEMHIVSLRNQSVRVDGRQFHFERGETIHTESSHKYSVDEFVALAGRAEWRSERVWVDADRLFSLHFLRRA